MKKNLYFKFIAILIGLISGFAIAEFIAKTAMPRPLYFPRIDLNEFQWSEHNSVILWNQKREDKEKLARDTGKCEASYRIVGLGDSIMFGSGIDLKNTYINRLGSELEKFTGRETEVVDLSQPGFNIKQEASLFDLAGILAKPHLIIIHAWYDDLAEYIVVGNVIYGTNVYTKTGVVRSIPLPLVVNQFLIMNSRLYQYLSLQAMKPQRKSEEENIQNDIVTFKQATDSIYENALKSDAKILILLSPPLEDGVLKPFDESGTKDQLYKMIIDWSQEHKNVEVLDLGGIMAGIDATKIRVDTIHFNKKGHDLILKTLAEHIAGEYLK